MNKTIKTLAMAALAAFTSGFAPSAKAEYTEDCITFSSAASFTLRTADDEATWNGTLEWSTDKTNWAVWSGTTTLTAAQTGGAGDYYLYMRGSDANTQISNESAWKLTPTGANKIACTGNIETLRGATGNDPSPKQMGDNCYAYMFSGCSALTTAPGLPAMTLAPSCYQAMFEHCTSLTTVPALPAMALNDNCYQEMFRGCTSLTAAPALPATTLAESCYSGMFADCTSLTDAPELPATELPDYCYADMFCGCTSLEAPAMMDHVTTIGVEACYAMYCKKNGGAGMVLKVYTTPQTGYGKPWVVNALSAEEDWSADMFWGTAGDFTDNPEIGVTYYIKGEAPKPPVATVRIGEGEAVEYTTIEAAWEAACAGTKTTPATLTLLTNVTVTAKLIGPSNDDFSVIFDLNDKVITFIEGDGARIVHQHGKLSVVDNAANKTTKYFEPDETAYGRWVRTDAVTERSVTGGYFTGYAWLLMLSGGDVEISGVSFVGAKRNPIYTDSESDLTCGKITLSRVNFLGNVCEYSFGANPGAINLAGRKFQYVFEDCVFRENVSHKGGGAIGRVANGEFPKAVLESPPRLMRCVFENNRSLEADGGAVLLDANLRKGQAGAVAYVHPMIFEDCAFGGNEAGGNGGAIAAYCNAHVMLKNCVVTNNVAGGNGGGISMDGDKLQQGSDPNDKYVLINTTITGNRASAQGGGVYFAKTKSCFAAGTKVLMADGTEKAIEEIVEGDIVRTFDHEGGKMSSARVYLAFKGETKDVPFTLTFGATALPIVGRHDLLEKSSRKYVTISAANAHQYVGAEFYGADGQWHALTGVTRGTQAVDYYSLYTAQHQNVYANGMLTAPDDVDHLLNIYELDENLKADAAQLAADIAQYGLATFDECSTKYGMSRSWYDDAGAKYNYVAIGKGLATLEGLEALFAESTEGESGPPSAVSLRSAVPGGQPLPTSSLPRLTTSSVSNADPFADYDVGVLTLGANVVIKDNTTGDGQSNVYLNFPKDGEGATLISYIALAADHSGLCVGVTTVQKPTEGTDVQFTTGSAKAGDVVYFTSDEGYSVIYRESAIFLNVNPPSVATVKIGTGEAVEYTTIEAAWTAACEGTAGKAAVLTLLKDVTTTSTLQATRGSSGDPTVMTLDLNGCVLKAQQPANPADMFNVIDNAGTLTVKDSKFGDTTIPHYFVQTKLYGQYDIWTLTDTPNENVVYGGLITGGALIDPGEEGDVNGGAINNYSAGGSLTIVSGNIAGNFVIGNEADGGAIASGVDGATFLMTGGEVCYNSSSVSGGGIIVYEDSGTAAIQGGKIHHNLSASCAGVAASGTATLTISGGEIYGNSAIANGVQGSGSGGGAGVTRNTATLIVEGGKIYDNTADGIGGGGILNNLGTVEIAGGEIYNNAASGEGETSGLGGGVGNTGTLTISGGAIYDNSANTGGAGVANITMSASPATVTMTGGAITNNSGVAVLNMGAMTLGGTAVIAGIPEYNAPGLYLPIGSSGENCLVTISSETPFTMGAAIGVTTAADPGSGSDVQITTNGAAGDVDYFTSDRGHFVIFKDGALYLSVNPPTPTEPVEYVAPVYKSEGEAKSGIDHWVTNSVSEYTVVEASTSAVTWGTAGQESWYVVMGADVQIDGGVTCAGDVNLILCDGASLTIENVAYSKAGIATDASGSFTVYGQPDGAGVLAATSGEMGAGIGGGNDAAGSNITINGGTVKATGDNYGGAGIGGGSDGAGSNITINGGTVTATGGNYGAGIGGGKDAAGSNITINGGTVVATTYDHAAGIGGGGNAPGGFGITINGGNVTAVGGYSSAGIGGGPDGAGVDIAVNGGTVTAEGGLCAAGIGGGCGSAWSSVGVLSGVGSNITIRAGKVFVRAPMESSSEMGIARFGELIGGGASAMSKTTGVVIESGANVCFNLTGECDEEGWIVPSAPMPDDFSGLVVMTPENLTRTRVLAGGAESWSAGSTFALTNAATGATLSADVGQKVEFASQFCCVEPGDGSMSLVLLAPEAFVDQLPDVTNGYVIAAHTDANNGIVNYAWMFSEVETLNVHALTNLVSEDSDFLCEGESIKSVMSPVIGNTVAMTWGDGVLPEGGEFHFTCNVRLIDSFRKMGFDVGTLTQDGENCVFVPKKVEILDNAYVLAVCDENGGEFQIDNLTYEINAETTIGEGATMTQFPADKGVSGQAYFCRMTLDHNGVLYTDDSEEFTYVPPSVEYRYPVYNTPGDPASGIARWEAGTTNVILVQSSEGAVTWGRWGEASWYAVANAGVVLCDGALCAGDVNLILCKGAWLEITNGVSVAEGASFTVYGQPDGAGEMWALGNDGAAITGSRITLNGGTIAVSGKDALIGGDGASGVSVDNWVSPEAKVVFDLVGAEVVWAFEHAAIVTPAELTNGRVLMTGVGSWTGPKAFQLMKDDWLAHSKPLTIGDEDGTPFADAVLKLDVADGALKMTVSPLPDEPVVKDESGQDVTIVVPEDWRVENEVLDEDAVDTKNPMENGMLAWQDYVLGLDPKNIYSGIYADSPQNTSADKVTIETKNLDVQKLVKGYGVKYRLDTKLRGKGEYTKGVNQDAASFEVSIAGEDPTGVYKLNAVIFSNGVEIAQSAEAVNIVGMLKQTQAITNAIISVPWSRLAPGLQEDIGVTNVVKTATLEEGDELRVYRPGSSTYEGWTLDANKQWVPSTTVAIDADGKAAISVAAKATDATIPRGSGIWLCRKDPSKPYYLYGQAEGEASAELTQGPNLIGATGIGEYDLNEHVRGAQPNDSIVVTVSGAVPKVFSFKDGAWGRWAAGEAKTIKDRYGNVTTSYTTIWKTDDAKIAPGTGFWLHNNSGKITIK